MDFFYFLEDEKKNCYAFWPILSDQDQIQAGMSRGDCANRSDRPTKFTEQNMLGRSRGPDGGGGVDYSNSSLWTDFFWGPLSVPKNGLCLLMAVGREDGRLASKEYNAGYMEAPEKHCLDTKEQWEVSHICPPYLPKKRIFNEGRCSCMSIMSSVFAIWYSLPLMRTVYHWLF